MPPDLKTQPSIETKIGSPSITSTDLSKPEIPTTSAPNVEDASEASTAADLQPTEATTVAETETTTLKAVGYTGLTAGADGDYGDPAAPTSVSALESAPTQGLTSGSSLGNSSSPQTGDKTSLALTSSPLEPDNSTSQAPSTLNSTALPTIDQMSSKPFLDLNSSVISASKNWKTP